MLDLLNFVKRQFSGVMDGLRDAGHDTPVEKAAAQALGNIRTWDEAPSESLVEFITYDGPAYIKAWVNPFHDDPVKVHIYADGRAMWTWTDNPNQDGEWNGDFSQNDVAGQIVSILKDHHNDLFALERNSPIFAPVLY